MNLSSFYKNTITTCLVVVMLFAQSLPAAAANSDQLFVSLLSNPIEETADYVRELRNELSNETLINIDEAQQFRPNAVKPDSGRGGAYTEPTRYSPNPQRSQFD